LTSERYGDEDPHLSAAAVESAAWSARAVTTSTVLEEVHPDGTVNEGYPYRGFWSRFMSSLENRWRITKKKHREKSNSYENDDAAGQTKLITDGGRDQSGDGGDRSDDDDLARVANALELQNALLLQLVQDQRRQAAREHSDPDHTGSTDRATATDVVDSYGDLYGGSFGWEFDPIDERIDDMGDSR